MKKATHILLLILINQVIAVAQKEKVQTTPNYDKDPIHFGFLLGINKTDFFLHRKPTTNLLDSVYVIETTPQRGFDLQMVCNLRLGEYFDLRLLPGLSFVSRNINYTFVSPLQTLSYKKDVESTFITLPLDLKYKSVRLNNYRVYVLGGLKYSIDMASNKDVNNSDLKVAIVKIKKQDLAYEFGFGLDIYFRYYKFSPEIKYAVGITNLLIQDNTAFSTPIQKLNSKCISLAFTFE